MRFGGCYAVTSYQTLFIVRDVFIVIWLTDKIEISMNYSEGADKQKTLILSIKLDGFVIDGLSFFPIFLRLAFLAMNY